MSDILKKIVADAQIRISHYKRETDEATLQSAAEAMPAPANFLQAIENNDGVALIAEIKRASPSKGMIRENFDPVSIARDYQNGGATCLSVLTEEKHFLGHLDYLTAVKSSVEIPLLRKDFIIDPYQVFQAKVCGASAVLLIAECLNDATLNQLHDLIVQIGLTPLVEFHDEKNLQRSVDCGAQLIGINNRDLRTFETDLTHCIGLSQKIPKDRTIVAESGIYTYQEVRKLEEAGINAMLVGESLMRESNLVSAVHQLLGKEDSATE